MVKDKTIDDYKVTTNDTIHAVLRLRGGVGKRRRIFGPDEMVANNLDNSVITQAFAVTNIDIMMWLMTLPLEKLVEINANVNKKGLSYENKMKAILLGVQEYEAIDTLEMRIGAAKQYLKDQMKLAIQLQGGEDEDVSPIIKMINKVINYKEINASTTAGSSTTTTAGSSTTAGSNSMDL